MTCVHQLFYLLVIIAFTGYVFAIFAAPLGICITTFAAIISGGAATDSEPGHVSDESMNVDFQRIRADREKIDIARDFYLERTVGLRRPHNCSDSVPESYRHVLAPEGAGNSTYEYNATAAAIAREVLGSTM